MLGAEQQPGRGVETVTETGATSAGAEKRTDVSKLGAVFQRRADAAGEIASLAADRQALQTRPELDQL